MPRNMEVYKYTMHVHLGCLPECNRTLGHDLRLGPSFTHTNFSCLNTIIVASSFQAATRRKRGFSWPAAFSRPPRNIVSCRPGSCYWMLTIEAVAGTGLADNG